MRYSYIKPRRKPPFNLFTRIWIIFGGFSVALIMLTFVVCTIRVYSISSSLDKKRTEFTQMLNDIEKTKEKINFLTRLSAKAKNIQNANSTLNNSIRNLFKLVPPSIVFSDLLIFNDKLIIKGATPTKEAFITLLETPLKSIFTSSKTSFYLLENGWYDFINVNKAYQPLNLR